MSNKAIFDYNGSVIVADLFSIYKGYNGNVSLENNNDSILDKKAFDDNTLSVMKSSLYKKDDVKKGSKIFVSKSVNAPREIIRRNYNIVRNTSNADFVLVDLSKIKLKYYYSFNDIYVFYIPSCNISLYCNLHRYDKTKTYEEFVDSLRTRNEILSKAIPEKFGTVVKLNESDFRRCTNFDEYMFDIYNGCKNNKYIDISELDTNVSGNDINIENINMLFAVKCIDYRSFTNKTEEEAKIQLIAIASLNWRDYVGTLSRVLIYLCKNTYNYRSIINCKSRQPTSIKNFIEVCNNYKPFANENDLNLYQDWMVSFLNASFDRKVADLKSIMNLIYSKKLDIEMFEGAYDTRVMLMKRKFKPNDETIE